MFCACPSTTATGHASCTSSVATSLPDHPDYKCCQTVNDKGLAPEVVKILDDGFAQFTREELLKMFSENDMPCEPAQTPNDIYEDQNALINEYIKGCSLSRWPALVPDCPVQFELGETDDLPGRQAWLCHCRRHEGTRLLRGRDQGCRGRGRRFRPRRFGGPAGQVSPSRQGRLKRIVFFEKGRDTSRSLLLFFTWRDQFMITDVKINEALKKTLLRAWLLGGRQDYRRRLG